VIPIGGNLAAGGTGQFSYENMAIFRNRVREGRGFTTLGSPWSAQVPLDQNGWPTAGHSVVLWEGGTLPGWAKATAAAPFKCGFIGSGTPSAFLGCVIGNVVLGDGKSTYTTFDLYNVTGNFGFQNSAGCVDEFAYLPAYPDEVIDDVTQALAYTPEALALWKQFAFVRPMWATNAAMNTQVNAGATRRTPANTQAYQGWSNTNSEGYPQEWWIYLAKYAGIGYWCCLPALEDGPDGGSGSYSQTLLALINAELVPSGKQIYLEAFADELWNGGYPVSYSMPTGAMMAAAVKYGFATSTSDLTGALKYLGFRIHALANMCRSIFGSAFGTQVQIVLGGQLGGNGYATIFPTVLGYLEATYGPPAADVQALALAPYVNLKTNAADTSVNAVLADLSAQAPLAATAGGAEHAAILARHWKLPGGLLMYEGQWQVNAEAPNASIPAALASPQLTPILLEWLRACVDAGFQCVNWFEVGVSQSTGANTPVDELTTDWPPTSINSPQLAAIAQLGAYTPQRNVVAASGTVISSPADVLTSAPPSLTNWSGFLFGFGCAPYQFEVPEAGAYELSLLTVGSGTVAVELDGTIVNPALVISSASTPVGSYNLAAGQHHVAVGSASYQAITSVELQLTPSAAPSPPSPPDPPASPYTGCIVGVRQAAGGAAGVYPYLSGAPAAVSIAALLGALTELLPPGTYVAAVQAYGNGQYSAWGPEAPSFTVPATAAVPVLPPGVTVP
jgi:hypothetical protein